MSQISVHSILLEDEKLRVEFSNDRGMNESTGAGVDGCCWRCYNIGINTGVSTYI